MVLNMAVEMVTNDETENYSIAAHAFYSFFTPQE